MLAIENITGFSRLMFVLGAILAFLRKLAIGCECNEPWNDRDICEFFARFAIGMPSWFVAIGAYLEVFVGTNVAQAGVRAAVVDFRLKARQKSDSFPERIEFREGGFCGNAWGIILNARSVVFVCTL